MQGSQFADVIIVGGGLAGLYTALEISTEKQVYILIKDDMQECNSVLAQGGIAAVVKADDAISCHREDTLRAGAYMNDPMPLKQLITLGPKGIKKLVELGVVFDEDEQGYYKTTMEGGHSNRRILHAGGDATGRKIMEVLWERVRERHNIVVLYGMMGVDLIIEHGTCKGIKVLIENKIEVILASQVVLATGGIGGLYEESTNPALATGDGIAMAYRAGCQLERMAFVQFHPTAFFSVEKGKRFLISEALRGEGAYLRNEAGERFMTKYHPRGELAPRDIVSQGIYFEMQRNGSSHIFLDTTHRDGQFLQKRFPTIHAHCLKEGFDLSKDPIPVVPVEHYFIGGIRTDLMGRTTIPNLYACGECASTRVHGANRLASNSLLECVVFGGRVAEVINGTQGENRLSACYDFEGTINLEKIKDKDMDRLRERLQEVMSKKVGIVRRERQLKGALKDVDSIIKQLDLAGVVGKKGLELLNMLTVAKLIIKDALSREESIGCHLRVDNIRQDGGA